jgi:hypothetical protein
MRTISTGVLLAAALLIPASAASASSHCSPLHGGFETHIVAYGFNCTVAHKIVNLWHYKAVTKGQGPGNKTVGDFRCRSKATDAEHVNVVCRHKEFTSQKVTFFAGP